LQPNLKKKTCFQTFIKLALKSDFCERIFVENILTQTAIRAEVKHAFSVLLTSLQLLAN
jgi:hypothetical protein